MSLVRLIGLRFLSAFFVLLAISAILFLSVETLPGDFASATAPRFVTNDQLEFTREELGLYDTAAVRYLNWVGRAVTGDFGVSWYTRQPIAPMLSDRIGSTALLAGLAALMAIPAGFLAALISVILQGGLFDRTVTGLSLALISMPE